MEKIFLDNNLLFDNYWLSDSINYYKEDKKSKINTSAAYKIEFPFLKEVNNLALANEQLQVKVAYKNLFNGSGFPKYKNWKLYN